MAGPEGVFTILLADDSEVLLLTCGAELEASGYRVLRSTSGEEALYTIEKECVDLMLLDVVMPGMNGLEVLEALRRNYDAEDLPVIMATSRDRSEDIVQAFGLGANDYVVKPLDMPVVEARIQAQLRSRTPRREAGEKKAGGLDVPGPGRVLLGKYRLETLISRGQHGSVYRGRHLQLDHGVAIKMLRADLGDRPDLLARFRQEAVSTCRLHHPNAVSVLDYGVSEWDVPFLVMELLEGRTLEELLSTEAKLSLERAVEIVLPICEVLEQAHTLGLVHRDIKPHNIFLHETARGEVVKVVDFGIAKWVGELALSDKITLDRIPGTPVYMAPERFSNETFDGSVDIYSVGVLLYQMLSGSPPFGSTNLLRLMTQHLSAEPDPLGELCPGLPSPIADIVHRCLAKDHRHRPSAAELVAILGELSTETLASGQ